MVKQLIKTFFPTLRKISTTLAKKTII